VTQDVSVNVDVLECAILNPANYDKVVASEGQGSIILAGLRHSRACTGQKGAKEDCKGSSADGHVVRIANSAMRN
jgi:hypothetical protein